MHDARRVRGRQGPGHFAKDPRGARGAERPPRLDQLAERVAGQELHHEIRDAVGHPPEIGDLHDVGVLHAGRRLGLEDEARRELGFVRQLGPEDLHGERPVERGVTHVIDAPHPSLAEDRHHVVTTVDARADQRIRERIERRRLELHAVERAERRVAREPVLARRADRHLATDVDGLLSRRRFHPAHSSRRRACRTARPRRVKRRPLAGRSGHRCSRSGGCRDRRGRSLASRRRTRGHGARPGQRRAARPWATQETTRRRTLPQPESTRQAQASREPACHSQSRTWQCRRARARSRCRISSG